MTKEKNKSNIQFCIHCNKYNEIITGSRIAWDESEVYIKECANCRAEYHRLELPNYLIDLIKKTRRELKERLGILFFGIPLIILISLKSSILTIPILLILLFRIITPLKSYINAKKELEKHKESFLKQYDDNVYAEYSHIYKFNPKGKKLHNRYGDIVSLELFFLWYILMGWFVFQEISEQRCVESCKEYFPKEYRFLTNNTVEDYRAKYPGEDLCDCFFRCDGIGCETESEAEFRHEMLEEMDRDRY